MNVRVIFHYQDEAGAPLADVALSATSSLGPWTGVTDATGNFDTGDPAAGLGLGPGDYFLTASKSGYVTDNYDGKPIHIHDAGTINRALQRATSAVRVQGINFVDVVGRRKVFNGTDAFCAFRQYLDGGSNALLPFFAESAEFEFDCWRVFFMGSKAQNGVLDLNPTDPGVYDHVRPFAELVNAHGLTLLATINVDAQDKCPTVTAQRENWTEMAHRLRGTNTLLSVGNEWRKNGFDPGNFSDPLMPWSRGSDLSDAAPFKPYATFAEFHPRRDMPAAVMDATASAVFIHGAAGLNGPLFIDEPPKFGTNGSSQEFTDPFTAYRFARHYATECAGAVFHNFFGQRGQLMDDHTRLCAEAWSKGMRL